MMFRCSIRATALAAALAISGTSAQAQGDPKFPDWSGQWKRPPGAGIQWDQTKRPGRRQQPPLTPEYQAIFEASLADQAAGGQGENVRVTCVPNGMPRMMTVIRPIEFVLAAEDHLHQFREPHAAPHLHRRALHSRPTRSRPLSAIRIGNWIDEDGDGRYDVLEVETRNFKGPRTFEASGIPLHRDNQTVVKERIRLDTANKDILLNEITTIDNAFTRPWVVTKSYIREQGKVMWFEDHAARTTTTSSSARTTIS